MNILQESKRYIRRSLIYTFNKYSSNYPLRKGKVDFIFIHINKTAGTSICKAINLPGINHWTSKEIIEIVGKRKWNSSYKFAIVRNPWDKVLSQYNYRVKNNKKNMSTNPISFTEWINITYGNKKDEFHHNPSKMFLPQIDWLLNDKDKLDIDFIGRFENLESDFQKIAKTIGVSPNLPHLNKSKNVNYRNFYDNETKKIVQNWFKKDIELFKYQY